MEVAGNSLNCLKFLEMARIDWKRSELLKMAGSFRKLPGMAGTCGERHDMAKK